MRGQMLASMRFGFLSRQYKSAYTCNINNFSSLPVTIVTARPHKKSIEAPPTVHKKMSTSSADNAPNGSNTITIETINANVKEMEYAVRGPLVIRAGQIERELREGKKKPFSQVIRANIGDCHAVGQKPITFIRQVLACCADVSLLDDGKFPEDVKQRARDLLKAAGSSAGCYSDSAGIELIRRHCAEYITARDGVESNWEDIVLTTGASEAVRLLLTLINSSAADGIPTGVLIPIPQYPLYTATLAEYGMHPISYYLDEAKHWALDIKELERALEESKGQCKPKAIVIINPGNPTGSVLTKENIEQIIKFARKSNLMVIADEVYQHNVYQEGAAFYSFKKVLHDLNIKLELASLMSASKGFMGECGLRGGYCEFINLQPEVKTMFLKMLSARLCSSVLGQIALDCAVKNPAKGDPSYELFEKEKNGVLTSLKDRARLVAKTFNSIPGMKSNEVAGAMYAFPEITIPPKALEAAKAKNMKADFFYCMELLETTGICVVPGSGFGQSPGTYHFRTTILPQPEKLKTMMDKLKKFHTEFTEKYS
ncbi:Alanine aminotransferase 2 [Halotydeus destructor]|nr:Alanine aminotransferase 2 [Halotydeus destructor]